MHKGVGIAAVRRVASALGERSASELAVEVSVEEASGRLRVTWPDAPDVIVVRGGGIAGMLVAGTHSAVAEASWRLQAVIRLFARAGRGWTWPDGVLGGGAALPGQLEVLTATRAALEDLIAAGLSHAGPRSATVLAALGQRARLEDLPLLARRLRAASGLLDALAARSDEVTEADVLARVSDAWALVIGLASVEGPLPAALVGRAESVAVEVGRLVCVGGGWWTTPTARGLTLHFLDLDSGQVETVTTGRESGADPTFQRSVELPLIWNASVDALTSGPIRLTDAQRRPDGTLSPTTRTRCQRDGDWSGVDPAALSTQLDAARPASDSSARVQLVVPARGGVGPLELDEVRQEVVWTVRTTTGPRRLRVDAVGAPLNAITWLLAQHEQIIAIAVVDDRPEGLWVRNAKGVRLVLPTMAHYQVLFGAKRLRKRLQVLRELKTTAPAPVVTDPLVALLADVSEVLTGLAASGARTPSRRDADTLTTRRQQAHELGLATLASALGQVATRPAAADILWASTLVGRLEGPLG